MPLLLLLGVSAQGPGRRGFTFIRPTQRPAPPAPAPAVPLQAGAVVPGEVLVGMRAPAPAAAARAAASVGTLAGTEQAIGVHRVRLAPGVSIEQAIARLRQDPAVLFVEPNHIVRAFAAPNDTFYRSYQWAPQKVQAERAWEIWKPRAPVVVAIVDTGIDYDHPDLAQVLQRDATGAVVGYNTVSGSTNADDDQGHGTHCAGITAAQTNNSTGIAGLAGWGASVTGTDPHVRLMPVKVLDETGSGTDATVADGIVWAVDHGAKVISLSLGGPSYSATSDRAVQYAWSKGCVVVAAAGNENSSMRAYPAAYDNTISVAATDSRDTLASFSNYGPWVHVAAPGVQIYSTIPGGGYDYMSGTSMATPYVAGEAAAIIAQNPALSNRQVRDLIVGQVDGYLPYAGRTLASGAGRINFERALRGAQPAAEEAPAALSGLTLTPHSVTGGATVSGAVSLVRAAPAGGVSVTLSSSSGAAAAPPASVLVPAGATAATFNVRTEAVRASTPVTMTAALNGASRTASLTILPPSAAGLTLSASSVVGGAAALGTVTLSGPAPGGGIAVSLSSGSTDASVPESVTVAGGSSAADFSITTGPVAASTSVSLTASLNGQSRSASLTLLPPGLTGVALTPASATGGAELTGTVRLSGPAPAGGIRIGLSSSDPAVVVPEAVTVPEGRSLAPFTASTRGVSASTSVTVTATFEGSTRDAAVTVLPAGLAGLALSASSVVGGNAATGTVRLASPAPAAGVQVSLSSSAGGVAGVPSSVRVESGATTATFPVTTARVTTSRRVQITATAGSSSKSASLWVVSLLGGVSVRPNPVTAGARATGTVSLNAPAPKAGAAVLLRSSNAKSAAVPARVLIPAGRTSATFTVTTLKSGAGTAATLTAVYAGAARTTRVTVK